MTEFDDLQERLKRDPRAERELTLTLAVIVIPAGVLLVIGIIAAIARSL